MKKIILALLLLLAVPLLSKEKPRLHICTTASDWDPGVDKLLRSCKENHLNVEIFGLGEPFSFDRKLGHCQSFISNLPDDDVVMYVDAYDILILASEDRILDEFFKMEASIVFSVEPTCYPFPQVGPYYPKSPTRYRYLNSGSYIGYVKDLKRVFAEMMPIPEETDDQGLFLIYHLYYPERFHLDHYCKLFLTLRQTRESEIYIDPIEKNVKCLLTGTTPCIVHGNGREGRIIYHKIYDQLFPAKN